MPPLLGRSVDFDVKKSILAEILGDGERPGTSKSAGERGRCALAWFNLRMDEKTLIALDQRRILTAAIYNA